MTKFADLHIHTQYSDGTLSCQDIITESLQAGLACISITDHDSLDGIKPTMALAKEVNLEVISGIELSSEINGKDIHILGYFIDEENQALLQTLKKIQQIRIERIKKMIQKLKELDIGNIHLEEVCSLGASKALGRPHLAACLEQKGYVSSIKEAFDRFLAEGKPAYVKKYKQSPQEAIDSIRQADGLAVLAHPMVSDVDDLIPAFVEAGLKGLEIFYPGYQEKTIQYYEGLAQKYQLLITGGSDSHGKTKSHTAIGCVKIPYDLVERLKDLYAREKRK
ncbi:MAG: PHP domain-containing protein [Candidatus Omnitrophota bacterium]